MAEGEVGAVAPVVNAPAADAVPTPDAPAVQENVEGQKPEEPVQAPKTYTEEETRKLVNERLTKERKRLERAVRAEVENDYLRKQLEARDRPQATQQPPGRPKESDFEGRPYSEYAEALAEWKADQKIAKFREEMQRETAAQRQQRAQAESAQFVHDKIFREGTKKHSDFVEKVTEVDGITEPMVAAATRITNGSDVLYHLADNDAERLRIAALEPIDQIIALNDLSKSLSAPPKTTDAPKPIKPNGTSGSTETGYRPDMTDKQFAEWRKRQKAQR